jgi:hypothetical protein
MRAIDCSARKTDTFRLGNTPIAAQSRAAIFFAAEVFARIRPLFVRFDRFAALFVQHPGRPEHARACRHDKISVCSYWVPPLKNEAQ